MGNTLRLSESGRAEEAALQRAVRAEKEASELSAQLLHEKGIAAGLREDLHVSCLHCLLFC